MIIVPGGSTGDIEGVTAGDGLSGTATSGTASLAVDLATNSGLEFDSNKLSIAKGISQHDVAQFAAGVSDDDFLRVDGTTIEGRSASEVLSDIGAGAAAGSSSIVTTGALDAGSITSNFGAINNGSSAITTTGNVSAGTVTLGDTGQLIIGDDAPSSDHTATGIVITMTALDGLAVGEAVYIDSNGKLDETDADAAGTMPAIGVALEANSSGSDAEVKVLLQGVFRDDTYNFTPGADLFIGTNLGEITATAPSGTGDFVQKVGVALTADTIYFNPSLDLIEHA